MPTPVSRRHFLLGATAALTCGGLFNCEHQASAEPRLPVGTELPKQSLKGVVIPGTGQRVPRTGDDFEDEKWVYYPQHPKSSYNIDENIRAPGGVSANYLWVEAAKRGTPDVVKRVPTPKDGIEGSKGSLMMQTLYSGVPGKLSGADQQDDLLQDVKGRFGSEIPCSWSPSVTVRVWVPPADRWEMRYDYSFGFRAGLMGRTPKGKDDEFWPGIFLEQQYDLKSGEKHCFVRSRIRGDEWGRDLPGPTYECETWITMGMSFTPDGRCHFFSKAGIEDLTAADHLGSWLSYNWRAHTFMAYFFNVMNRDDGRSLSTPWIIDDPALYVASAPQQQRAAQKPTGVKQTGWSLFR